MKVNTAGGSRHPPTRRRVVAPFANDLVLVLLILRTDLLSSDRAEHRYLDVPEG